MDAVAGGPHGRVDPFRAAVGEDDGVPVQPFDAGAGDDLAVGEAVQDGVADGGVVLEQAARRCGQAVALRGADGQPQHRLRDALTQPPGQGREGAAGRVGGPSEEVLGDDVHTVAGRQQHRAAGDIGGVDGDVHRGVAHADNKHPAVPEVLGAPVVVGVCLAALEGSRVRRFGPTGVPVVAVGDHDRVVPVRLAGSGRHGPALLGPLDGRDGRAEPDVLGEAEFPCVVGEITGDEVCGRVVRPVARHGEVGELGASFAGVEVQGGVGRGQSARVVPRPQPAGPIALFVGDDPDSRIEQGLGGGEAGRTGADHGDAAGWGHGGSPEGRGGCRTGPARDLPESGADLPERGEGSAGAVRGYRRSPARVPPRPLADAVDSRRRRPPRCGWAQP